MKRQLLYLSIIFLLLTPAIGQKRSLQIGGKIINELTFYNGYTPGGGIQAIYRIGKHGGIESGVYYKIRRRDYFLQTINGILVVEEVTERNIIIPFLYRFDSKHINFTIGPAVEFFLGWKVKKTNYNDLTGYRAENPELISTASVSRNFNLPNNWIFEPELRFSAFVPRGDGGFGLNFSFRKKLH